MFHVREFERWRDAPANQKGRIASDQVARHGIATLFPIPGDDPTNIAGLEAGYCRVFQDWPRDRVEEFLSWVGALRSAARDQLELLTLACGDC